jgi:preprotein translocase subunit SecA
MDQAPSVQVGKARNMEMKHQDSTGLGFTPAQEKSQSQQPSRSPIISDKKVGRNEKVEVISPSGKREIIKYKKLQNYLNRGYTQA